MGNYFSIEADKLLNSVKTDIEYLDLIQTDITKFNKSQEEKRKIFRNKYGDAKYFGQMHSNKHNSLKENRTVDYSLTNEEIEKIKRDGYFVKQINNNNNTFAKKYLELYNNNMPVIVTSDSILHAFHKFYDEFLQKIEKENMWNKIIEICKNIHQVTKSIDVNNKYVQNILPLFEVPLCIANENNKNSVDKKQKYYRLDNGKKIDELLVNINNNATNVTKDLINKINKNEDISFLLHKTEINIMGSQFKPRGHYTKSKELELYFKIFTWLSKFTVMIDWSSDEYLDNLMLSCVITRLCKQSMDDVKIFTNFIEKIIGECDGLNIITMNTFLDNILVSDQLIENELEYIINNIKLIGNQFKEYLENNNNYMCKYNKFSCNLKPGDKVTSFTIIGKGSNIDNYVISQMVDNNFVLDNGSNYKRKFIDIMDVIYCVFNNESAYELLKKNMETSHSYEKHLDKIKNEVAKNFEHSKSIYQQQLKLLKSLTLDKKTLEERGWWPFYTKNWDKKQVNTQIAHYSEMRHDNVLYLDEYEGCCMLCQYPDILIEPVPTFWNEFLKLIDMMMELDPKNRALNNFKNIINKFIEYLNYNFDNKQPPIELVESLKSIIEMHMGSGDPYYKGWYMTLFMNENDALDFSPEVSSYLTAVDDDRGPGGIQNLGTGNIQMLYVLFKDLKTGSSKIYIGPIYSSYIFDTEYNDRLNDEEWNKRYKNYKPFNCN